MKQITEIDDARLVKGLAHPLRIQILRALHNRVASPSEIAAEIGAPLGNVSYHVRFLARVGLIELDSTKPRRGAVEHYYRAAGRVTVTEQAWAQVPQLVKNSISGATLSSIFRVVGQAAANGGFDVDGARVSRQSLVLDPTGFSDLAVEFGAFLERANQIERASAERLAANGNPGAEPAAGVEAGLVMLLFHTPALHRCTGDNGDDVLLPESAPDPA
jgi:DNA-binding transcriptional ArsR family regulator